MIFDSAPYRYETQEMCDKAVSDNAFKNWIDRYKAQEICNKAVDDFLPALKFVPYWSVTSKMI